MSDNFNLEEILKKFKEIGSDSAAIKAESATLKAENQNLSWLKVNNCEIIGNL